MAEAKRLLNKNTNMYFNPVHNSEKADQNLEAAVCGISCLSQVKVVCSLLVFSPMGAI